MWRDVRTWLSCAGCIALVACSRPNPAWEARGGHDGDPPASIDAGVPDATTLAPDLTPADGAPPRLDAAPVRDSALTPDTAPPRDTAGDRASVQAGQDMAGTTVNLQLGLIGYWDMDETAGSPTAHDRSGNGNDGTLEAIAPATAWVAGHHGTALAVAGTTDRTMGVRVANNAAISAIHEFTVAAWFYDTDASTTAYRAMISRQLDGSDSELFHLAVVHGYLKLYLYRAPSIDYFAVSPQLSPHNRWAHAAATYDGTTARLYLDGAEVDNVKYTEPFPPATTPLYLGTNKNLSNPGEPFVGNLDDLLLYSRALSPAEIQALANGMHP